MHITQHTDYALRALIYLGSNPDRLVTILEISERFDVSRTHLMKVVSKLIRAGFIEGIRGKGGGLRLQRAPIEIRIGDVVREMEPDLELAECFGTSSSCVLNPECKLKHALLNALSAFLASLDSVSLANLLGERESSLLHLLQRMPSNPKNKSLK